MPENDPKKIILDRLKSSLRNRRDKSLGVATPPETDSGEFLDPFEDLPEIVFARNLVKVNGKFYFCENKKELIGALSALCQEQKWTEVYAPEKNIRLYLDMAGVPNHNDPERMESVQAGITGCEYLVARTGTILISSAQTLGRRIVGHSPQHIVIATTSQIVNEMKQGLDGIRRRYGRMPGLITAITGPSRTADIEKTLVLGAHGPEELYVFLINDK